MTLIDFLNQIFQVLSGYVKMLFQMEVTTGVSMGSILLVGGLLFIIVTNFWPRQ